MATQPYYPSKEGDQIIWMENFKVKIEEHGPELGFDPAEISDLVDACDAIIDAINDAAQKKADAKQATEDKKAAKTTNLEIIRKEVGDLKREDGYTPGIGDDLKVIGEEQTIDQDNESPELETKKVPSGWEISFNLQNFFDGVKIYRKRPGEDFVFLATDTRNPYIDTDTQVDGTQYYAFYLIGDDEVGQQSDIITIEV